MSKVNMIGISGKLGVGKDYLAENILMKTLDKRGIKYGVFAFADMIKLMAATTERVDLSVMYGTKTPKMRKMLQKAGTENGRDIHGDDIWIMYLYNMVKLRAMREGITVAIITDCRFPNEADWCNYHGVTIRINASDRNNKRLDNESKGDQDLRKQIAMHSSETALDDYHSFKYVIDNSCDADQNKIATILNDVLDQI